MLADDETTLIRDACNSGTRFGNASAADIGRLRAAWQPLYAELARNPATRRYLAEVQQVKTRTPAGPALSIPTGCNGNPPSPLPEATSGKHSPIDGTYRWTLTPDDARRNGTASDNPSNLPATQTLRLDSGVWSMRESNTKDTGSGRFVVASNYVEFTWPSNFQVLRFTYSKAADGSLQLRAIPPMDVGDQFVWTTEPLTRVD
jgi:hypothetical protein